MFEMSRVYRRDELHRVWAGSTRVQAQGGILTPREAPLVLVVTGEEGDQYGYGDHWDDDGVFHYYGAGQVGDMEWARGNRAIRDHAKNGEELHVFEQVRPSGLRYVGHLHARGTTRETAYRTPHGHRAVRSYSGSSRLKCGGRLCRPIVHLRPTT